MTRQIKLLMPTMSSSLDMCTCTSTHRKRNVDVEALGSLDDIGALVVASESSREKGATRAIPYVFDAGAVKSRLDGRIQLLYWQESTRVCVCVCD